ncbi:hypothetical protein GP709_12615 [Escherichia coli]|uniref:Cell envelope biogenesis protein TolA n=3 Tax=Escherichia coli TaxID=562 RepID=A0A6N6WZU9_ECOLX|nr:hypothetical protein [Escherichia coli]KAE9731918.1 hypothetical protein GP711_09730 [Escherichia coli]KAE9732981.1 hypothetical protein GP709_12615 [Escherichia coli]MVV58958.1 hypothetical protein [Escherichia coli]MVV70204.1 hypothetical protein [Escherichia coli]MWP26269.1 hypothetical protein [Escherichia coli]
MMKGNKISFFLLLLFSLPSFTGAAEHQDDFLSDILKLDISDSVAQPSSPPPVQKKQREKTPKKQKKTADITDKSKKGTELSELTAQITALRQQNDKPLDKKKPGEMLSYSLGTYYLQKAMMDSKELEINGLQISEKTLTQGFNDASNKKLKLSEKEISDALSSVNRTVQRNTRKTESLLREKIGNKHYRKIQPGVYLVVNEKGKGKYADTDAVRFNMFEKKLDGTPVKNTMNASVLYKKADPLMRKLVNAGLKGGRVTIYGKALYIYKVLPKDISGDEIVSITFSFK